MSPDKPIKPHLDTDLSVTSDDSKYGFQLHDLLEDLDEGLADEIDEAGLAQNCDMLALIRLGWFHKQAGDGNA